MRILFSRIVPLLVALACAGPALAVDGPNPYLGQAKVFYQGLEFEKCVQRLGQAHKWTSTPEESVEIEIYGGLCVYNLGKERDAAERFAKALQLDPHVTLPAMTSPKIVELFRSVAAKVEKAQRPPPPPEPVDSRFEDEPTDTPRAAPQKPKEKEPEPKRLAPRAEPRKTEVPVAALPMKESSGSRAKVVAPAVLGGAALIAAGVGVYFGVQAKQMEARAKGAHFESDAGEFGQAAERNALVANVSYGVAGASALAALITYFAVSANE